MSVLVDVDQESVAMLCPRCHYKEFDEVESCPKCGYPQDGRLSERLSNLGFLLGEMKTWTELPTLTRYALQERYARDKRYVEVAMDLRQRPLTAEEALPLQKEAHALQQLRRNLPGMVGRSWLSVEIRMQVEAVIRARQGVLEERLFDVELAEKETFDDFPRAERQVAQIGLLLQLLNRMQESGELASWKYEETAVVLNRVRGQIEQAISFREKLAEEKEQEVISSKQSAVIREAVSSERVAVDVLKGEEGQRVALPKPMPRQQREAWSWDIVWETLLSERTLQAILFLGAMLMFSAAVSWVAWNWDTFPALAQVGFLGGFTALFYGLGWYVRTPLGLQGSGTALSGVASLLVPLDFYAFYISGGFPPDSWPWVWVLASAVCLVAYLISTFLIEAEFFGYLVGVAAGSLLVSLLNWGGITAVWWPTSLVALALGMALLSQWWKRAGKGLSVLVRPFAHLALATAVPVMAFMLGYSLIVGLRVPFFGVNTAVSWWLGSFVLLVMANRYRLPGMGWATALAFPVASWLTGRWLFGVWGVDVAWHGLGWALLTAVYFGVAWLLGAGGSAQSSVISDQLAEGNELEGIWGVYGRVAFRVGNGLVVLAAVWSLLDSAAGSAVHPLLAVTMLVVTVLWQQPRLVWLISLFLSSGAALWLANGGAAPQELALPWGLLSILHIVVALNLTDRKWQKRGWAVPAAYIAPLYGAGLVLAGLAILPPLVFWDRPLLSYAVGHWVGLNGWLAYLVVERQRALPDQHTALAMMMRMRLWRWLGEALFHWLAALAMIPWLALLWGERPLTALALTYAALAWGMLWLSVRLRKIQWGYGRPWQVAAHIGNGVALLMVLLTADGWRVMTAVLWSLSLFYFVMARVGHWREWLYLAAGLLPLAWLDSWDWLGADWMHLPVLTAVLVVAYVTVPLLAGRWGRKWPLYWEPLAHMGLVIAGITAVWSVAVMALLWDDPRLLWSALAYGLLCLAFVLVAWLYQWEGWAHVAVWLFALTGGLVVKRFSHGSGLSAR